MHVVKGILLLSPMDVALWGLPGSSQGILPAYLMVTISSVKPGVQAPHMQHALPTFEPAPQLLIGLLISSVFFFFIWKKQAFH